MKKMKRYFISLIIVTLAMTLVAFGVMWFAPERYLPAMPLLALYFGIVSGVQHWMVCRAMYKSPRAFIQIFLGSVVGVLLLHIIVLAVYLFTHLSEARQFTLAFCVCYVVYLVFETIALVRFVQSEKKHRETKE